MERQSVLDIITRGAWQTESLSELTADIQTSSITKRGRVGFSPMPSSGRNGVPRTEKNNVAQASPGSLIALFARAWISRTAALAAGQQTGIFGLTYKSLEVPTEVREAHRRAITTDKGLFR